MPVDERWCLIHATHIEPTEIERIAQSRAVVGLCPATEANLGDGLPDLPRIVLGTEPGERVMRPDFGAGLRSLVISPLLVESRVFGVLISAWPSTRCSPVSVPRCSTRVSAAAG